MAVSLKVKAELDRSNYDRGLDAIKRSATDAKQSLGAVGGIAAGVFGGNFLTGALSSAWSALTGSIKEAQSEIIKLGQDAGNIGVKPGDLDDAINVFERYGVSGERVIGMYGRLEAAYEGLIAKTPKMIKAFEALGISRDKAVGMGTQERFEAVFRAAQERGASGGASEALNTIFGRSFKQADVRRAAKAYGSGERVSLPTEVSEEDIIREQLYARHVKEVEKARSHFWATLWADMRNPETSSGQTVSLLFGRLFTGFKDMPTQSAIRNEKNERIVLAAEQKAAEKKALKTADFEDMVAKNKAQEKAYSSRFEEYRKRAEAEIAEQGAVKPNDAIRESAIHDRVLAAIKADLQGEEDTSRRNLQKIREDEIREGIRLDRLPADQYTKRGILAGGENFDRVAYSRERQQLEISRQIEKSSVRAERHLAEIARHTAALDRINPKRGHLAPSEPDMSEVETD